MWANPVNFFLILGILLWLPQLNVYRQELHAANGLLSFYSTRTTTAPSKSNEGPAKIAGRTRAANDAPSECLMEAIRIFTKQTGSSEVLYENQKIASRFLVEDQSASIQIESARLQLITHPSYDQFKWESGPIPEPITQLFSRWSVNDREVQQKLVALQKQLLIERACIPFGQSVTVTGYLSPKRAMTYTLSFPFTMTFGTDAETTRVLYSGVSKSYFGAALIFLMIAALGLGIMTNALLRGRITLEMEEVVRLDHPLRKNNRDETLPHEFQILAEYAPHIRDIQLAQSAELPVFYRYNWDDGASLKGRTAIFAISSSSLLIVEVDPKGKPKLMREVPWNDLFCVYFAQWGPTDTWLDILTREGERYQLSLKDAKQAQFMLKRWDAAELIQQMPAA